MSNLTFYLKIMLDRDQIFQGKNQKGKSDKSFCHGEDIKQSQNIYWYHCE
ncbi:hypothetical protein ACN4EE_18715 [Geminocystis sp. CENA526]